jgi:MAF protein
LLSLLGLPFEVITPNVAEIPQADEPPVALVVRLSQAKAHAAGKRNQVFQKKPGFTGCTGCKRVTIVACDTVVALDGELLGKPHNATEAIAMLHHLRGRSHTVYSGVTMLELTTGRTLTDVAETQVTMRAYTDTEITDYVVSGDPLDKAGAYAIQHPGFHPVARLQGCYANVMGLPLCHLTRCLRTWEIEPPRDIPTACQSDTDHNCPVYATILNDK